MDELRSELKPVIVKMYSVNWKLDSFCDSLYQKYTIILKIAFLKQEGSFYNFICVEWRVYCLSVMIDGNIYYVTC